MQWKREPSEKCGIHCGADQSQEWMLPWWWSRYKDHNDFPVTFFDFGMTEKMRAWALERGEVISIELDASWMTTPSQIDPDFVKDWEKWHGKQVWHLRSSWIKKPLTFLHSRYEKGIWIDLDCEILGSLKPLFSQCDSGSQIALVRDYTTDHFPKWDPRVHYNGGVVVFSHGSSIMEKWAQDTVSLNHLFAGDDYVLSHLIHTDQWDVTELPQIYNWRMVQGLNLDAVIVHWFAKSKAYIRKHGGIKPALDSFRKFCGGESSWML